MTRYHIWVYYGAAGFQVVDHLTVILTEIQQMPAARWGVPQRDHNFKQRR